DYYGQGGAIFADETAAPTVEDCTFTSNIASDGSAIFGNLEADITVRRSTFWNNSNEVITIGEDSQALIENCILAFNTGYAVSCFSNGIIWVQCSNIYGNTNGNWTGCITGLDGIMGNMELNPVMCDPAGGDYTLHASSPCAPANSGSCGLIGAWPVGCWNITTIAADGSGDYPTIQDAIDAAVGDGSEIIELLDGSYTGLGFFDIDYLGKALTIRSQSGNPEDCRIDMINLAVVGRGLIFQNDEGPNSVLEGVTVENGDHVEGAAIMILGAGPTIRNCVFNLNESDKAGAIYAALDADDTLTITETIFRGNTAIGDYAAAGALWLQGGNFEISDCLFVDNSANAGYPEWGSGGAVYNWGSVGSFSNCTFVRNESSGVGGAIVLSVSGSGLLLANCTMTGNSSPSGNAISLWNTDLTIQNSIIAFGQEGTAFYCGDDASLAISCSNIYGNTGGDWVGCSAGQQGINGNISADPQFCDAEHDDLSLTTSSPCAPFSPPNQYCELVG
ncbi:MAG: hypothetical protein GY722_26085, partial [bacterium]|nr:hypothetical protein [bacterium]